ncbi:YopX family protein [Brevibacillus brevis]|uniref:YopX family protein n=1 Tax=Brevibacillus brevis TaxID=1393 RepID=UPI0005A18F33|nr:YopX family protein [Brevibacillus brevis]
MQAGREVKYQVWIVPTREMKKVTALLFDDDGQLFGVKTPDSEINSCLSIHTVRIREFTSLHDKNGKEIYEGDIAQNKHGAIGVIRFHKTWGTFYFDTILGLNEENELVRMRSELLP